MSTTTTQLLSKHSEIFKNATEHQLTKELCQGTLSDVKLFGYLTQDLNFFEVMLRLICKITSMAPETPALITLAKKIGFFANDENSYFQDCLALISPNISAEDKSRLGDKTKCLPGVKPYVRFLEEMIGETFSYAELITYLWVAEEVYLKWAHDLPRKDNLHWKYQTWIDLHDGEHFVTWVNFLRKEVNKFPIQEVESMFVKCVNYEFHFFDACYKAGL